MHVHGVKRRSVEVTVRAGEVLVSSDAIWQIDAGRFRNGPTWPQQPNLYLEPKWLRDQRAKAWKYTCLLHLKKTQLYMCMGRREEVCGYGRSRRALVVRDARCHSAIDGMAVSDQDGYKSDHTLSFS
jgi:hypothetical protein